MEHIAATSQTNNLDLHNLGVSGVFDDTPSMQPAGVVPPSQHAGGSYEPGRIEYDDENLNYRVQAWEPWAAEWTYTACRSLLDSWRWLARHIPSGCNVAVTDALGVSSVLNLTHGTDERGEAWIQWDRVEAVPA